MRQRHQRRHAVAGRRRGQILIGRLLTVPAWLAAGTAGQILQTNGSGADPSWVNLPGTGVATISFGSTGLTPSTATAGAVTVSGTLGTANGGTGLTSFTSGAAVYASAANALTTGTLATTGGGTGLASFTSGGAVYATSTSALTTGTLPIASGGTGATSATGAGNPVLATGATIASATLTNPTLTGASLNGLNGGAFGLRNVLINGGMMIDQRNRGGTQTFTAGSDVAYCVDQWFVYCAGANVTGHQTRPVWGRRAGLAGRQRLPDHRRCERHRRLVRHAGQLVRFGPSRGLDGDHVGQHLLLDAHLGDLDRLLRLDGQQFRHRRVAERHLDRERRLRRQFVDDPLLDPDLDPQPRVHRPSDRLLGRSPDLWHADLRQRATRAGRCRDAVRAAVAGVGRGPVPLLLPAARRPPLRQRHLVHLLRRRRDKHPDRADVQGDADNRDADHRQQQRRLGRHDRQHRQSHDRQPTIAVSFWPGSTQNTAGAQAIFNSSASAVL